MIKEQNEQIIMDGWLLKLHKYMPDILPRNKDEAIGYFYLLKLLNDIFAGKFQMDKICYRFTLTSKKMKKIYGGSSKNFQKYLDDFFHRNPYDKKKKIARSFIFHLHIKLLLNLMYRNEWKPNDFRLLSKPISNEYLKGTSNNPIGS
jgi:hypothetical protein